MTNLKTKELFTALMCAAALALFSTGTALAQSSETLDQIRAAIAAKGAKWHADETSVSKLTHEEKKMRLGVIEGASHDGSSSLTPADSVTAAPATLDWRNVNGINYVSAVKNQGSCGSCWAFAVTAALESQEMMANAGAQRDYSEQILVSCSGAGSCSGGYPSSASAYITNVGLPAESCLPYTAADTACGNACLNWKASAEMVNGWHSVSSSVDAIKSAVYTNGPVVATFYVYNDFYSYRSGVYSYVSGAYVGAHAVLVVGYDNAAQSFLVKNSWGSGWGEGGYFQIAYSEVTGTSRFGYSVLAYDGYKGIPVPDNTAPTAAITAPADGATLAGTVNVAISAGDNVGVSSVDLFLDDALLGTDPSSPYSFAWSTNAGGNGTHSLKAVARDAAGNAGESSVVTVHVNNIPDTIPPTVTISPAGGTVSKMVKIAVKATDAVQVKRVEAYVDGKLIGTSACSAASCSASFNWNSNSAAKGQHFITANAYDLSSNKGTIAVTVIK